MVNGIVSLISLSDILLLAYRSARDIYAILYPATLPNSLISTSSILVVSLGFSFYGMNLSKLWETVKDREAWGAAVYGVTKCWQDSATEKQQCIVSCHLQTVTLLLLFLFVLVFLFSFSSLVAVARTSKTILNNSGKIGHHCVVPDLKRKCFQFFIIVNDVRVYGHSTLNVPDRGSKAASWMSKYLDGWPPGNTCCGKL